MKRWLLLFALTFVFLLLAFSPPSPYKACRAFLEACGVEMAGDFAETEVVLPEASDAAWRPYLVMQKENGFSMEAYSGQRVWRLTCPVRNHPAGAHVYANLYWCDGKIIGGDIMSTALDGFMYGLKPSNT